MRTSSRVILLSVVTIMALIVSGGLFWDHNNRKTGTTHNEDDFLDQSKALSDPAGSIKVSEPICKENAAAALPASQRSLYDYIVRYIAAEDSASKLAIAKEAAFSDTHFLESCALRTGVSGIETIEYTALCYFATVYFNRGPQQKQELISLLQSHDVHLVSGLLDLLRNTSQLSPNGDFAPGPPTVLPVSVLFSRGVYKSVPVAFVA
jgi:hypothetical protein